LVGKAKEERQYSDEKIYLVEPGNGKNTPPHKELVFLERRNELKIAEAPQEHKEKRRAFRLDVGAKKIPPKALLPRGQQRIMPGWYSRTGARR